MTALSELDIHTWPARQEEENKKVTQREVFSQNVEPVRVLKGGPVLWKGDYKATNSPYSTLTHCPHR